jgi:hypothetical protein|tara:strand:- start:146 stop:1021 length:876 start_codon:yes stop_codon:yes gene_type:complete
MKRSKNFFVRFLLEFAKSYLPEKIHSMILFVRFFRKFKKEINKSKSNIKFSDNLDKINQHEYKITSQNNEDGIIEHIFKKIPNEKYFVEIGFDLYECNGLNLIKNGWGGKLIDQNIEECLALKSLLKHFFPNSKTIISNEKIDINNINDVAFSGLDKKIIDFFSIDIDGNDYWVLKNTDLKRINVICCEYNHWVGNNVKKIMPYNSEHQVKDNVYFGASLLAIHDLLKSRGFDLVAVDSSGTNAFFVKKKFAKYFEILSPIESWRSVARFQNENQAKKMRESVKNFKFVEL